MRRYIYNYSRLMKRERRIYNAGFQISGGVSVNFFKIWLPMSIGVFIIGWFISLIFKINMLNVLGENFNANYLIFWIVLSIGISSALYLFEFAGYKLYEYLYAYLRPKKVITNQNFIENGKRIQRERKKTNVKIKSVVRKKL